MTKRKDSKTAIASSIAKLAPNRVQKWIGWPVTEACRCLTPSYNRMALGRDYLSSRRSRVPLGCNSSWGFGHCTEQDLCDLGEVNPCVQAWKQNLVHMFSLACGSRSGMERFNIRVVSLPPWVDGSLPGLEGKVLADIHESKDICDFSFSHLG